MRDANGNKGRRNTLSPGRDGAAGLESTPAGAKRPDAAYAARSTSPDHPPDGSRHQVPGYGGPWRGPRLRRHRAPWLRDQSQNYSDHELASFGADGSRGDPLPQMRSTRAVTTSPDCPAPLGPTDSALASIYTANTFKTS